MEGRRTFADQGVVEVSGEEYITKALLNVCEKYCDDYYLSYLPITIRVRVNGVPLWVLKLRDP